MANIKLRRILEWSYESTHFELQNKIDSKGHFAP